MPIYEYQCAKCKKVHEIWQKITEPNATKCPDAKCGGKVERLISASGFALKGTGWYKTDYERKGKKDSGAGDSSSSTSSSESTSSDSKSESKPDSTPDGGGKAEKKKDGGGDKKKKDAGGSSEKKKDSGSDKKAQAG